MTIVYQPNATFHAFKPSGKWYTTDRGILSENCYGVAFTPAERRAKVLEVNGGNYPGLSSPGERFVLVVIPDETVEFGFPLLLPPVVGWEK